ncbi:hypothetical protein ADN00_15725 [Ornatilinea apprima]|uniref:Capsid protein n=1 Tax=Ornatilinea apprima TaxID=1134406 RepID=A0A0P6XBV9_9CHLR|nr:hypothetical protein [Ornatilinea apprima]KPL72265.1 hypothetical protein ADN00_15725 [Ornatilinea apprima]
MSNIFGLLNVQDYAADRTFVNQVGQQIVYDAVQQEIARIDEEINRALSVFVDERTSDFKRRYKLPGSGYMQPGTNQAPPANTKASGSWDIALPLLDFQDAVGGNRVQMAYMSVKDLNIHLDSLQIRAANSVRREILRALFNNTTWSFQDEIHGVLSVVPLANNDGTLYPAVVSSDTEAQDNHYLVSGYAASSISDTNDPIKSIVAEIYEHFGYGDNLVVFINSAQTAKVLALAMVEEVGDKFIVPGANTAQVIGLPAGLPGRIKGRHSSGAWIVEWDRVPANYMVGVHMDAPKPIIERVDPPETGLPSGLTLVARDEEFPLESAYYQMRRGFGVGNRLNGCVMFLDSGSTYTVPSAYGR